MANAISLNALAERRSAGEFFGVGPRNVNVVSYTGEVMTPAAFLLRM